MQVRKRLHITPLNPSLLPIVLTQTLLKQATNISYHTIETFPEKNYGYLDLPLIEADKLRKKLNGCVLKDQKMKVDDARPKKSSKTDTVGNGGSSTASKKPRSSKSKNNVEGVIPAIELPKERKVKRGWTEAEAQAVDGQSNKKKKKAKKEKKAKYKDTSITGEAECLFKTKLPPNAPSSTHDKGGKPKKRKRGETNREAVIHEFENTTKYAGFLRDDAGTNDNRVVKEYVDGGGWVDEDGNIVEKGPKRQRKNEEKAKSDHDDLDMKEEAGIPNKKTTVDKTPKAGLEAEDPQEEETDGTSSSGSSESEHGDEQEDGGTSSANEAQRKSNTRGRTKGLGISSIDDSALQTAQVERLSISRSSGSPSFPHVNTQPTSEPSTEVHPLETLFKRPKAAASETHTPKKPHLELSTSFSFFDADANEAGRGDSSLLMPQTPFTQQDIRHRRQRSAAPTPDTAAPGRTFAEAWGGNMDDIESEEEGEEEVEDEEGKERQSPTVGAVEERSADAKGKSKKKGAEKQESEFAKWFWEHRGENNRAWKRRKREAAKEKRVRDKREKQN
ncbi:MAG: hypothetical protein Q9217_006540 [Psora testacea]